ncbi:uncharacterized protein TNCV_3327061 [Trichonephila clavipes]|nr:uncharacterized protein TNCV_3327061 [Trichonephila clavipes]
MSPTHKWHKSGEKRDVLSSANHISGLEKKDVEALVAFPDLIWKDYFGVEEGETSKKNVCRETLYAVPESRLIERKF